MFFRFLEKFNSKGVDMKKFIKSLVLTLIILPCVVFMSACGGNPPPEESEYELTVQSIYELVQAKGYEGTFDQFLSAIKGENGTDGKDGRSITSIELTSSSDGCDTYTITYSDNTTSTYTITNGKDGTNGRGIVSISCLTEMPGIQHPDYYTYRILYTDSSYFDYKVYNGKNGDDGTSITSITQSNNDAENSSTIIITDSTGATKEFTLFNGTNGKDGTGIKTITKTSTDGLVDTYTITFTNDKDPFTYTITNGKDGADGIGIEDLIINTDGELEITLTNSDTPINVGKVKGQDGVGITDISSAESQDKTSTTITITYGNNNLTETFTIYHGHDGADGRGISSIVKTSVNGLVDTYTIIYTDDSQPYTFTVTNGQNGLSAYEIYKIYNPSYNKTEAEWIIDLSNGDLSTNRYTVTFDSNGGSEVINQTGIKYGGKATKPEDPIRQGYAFDGWYYQDEKWSFIGYSITENITLVAKWTGIKYTISFNTNGNGEIADQTLALGDELILPSFDFEGYTYEWQADGKKITDGIWNIAQDTIITLVKTSIPYPIEYILYGGENNSENPKTYTIETTKITLKEPTKENYYFVGWYADAQFIGEKITQIEGGRTGNVQLYARWVINQNTISFDANNGQLLTNSITVYYQVDYTLPTPIRDGYEFIGWFNGDDKFEDGVWTLEEDITLTASWSILTYTISYQLNGGTNADNPLNYTIRDGIITLDNPTQEGKAFAGWYETVDFSGEKVVAIDTSLLKNYSLYAKWETLIVEEDGAIAIYNESDFINCFSDYNNFGKTINLRANLNFAGAQIAPVGNIAKKFVGTFNGNDNTISNFKIEDNSLQYIGLFGYINGATISKLNIVDAEIISQNTDANINQFNCGILCGYSSGSQIADCHVSGNITVKCRTLLYVGGICAQAVSTSISNCETSGQIKSEGRDVYCGGVTGDFSSVSTNISQSSSICSIAVGVLSFATTNSYIGGVVGYYDWVRLGNLSYSGDIVVNSNHSYTKMLNVGGVVGYADSCKNCYSRGTITVNSRAGGNVGGIIGSSGLNPTIEECYSEINITYAMEDYYNSSEVKIGGILGYGCSITNSYATGTIDVLFGGESLYVGGLAGDSYGITKSYSAGKISVETVNSCNLYIGGLAGDSDRTSDAFTTSDLEITMRQKALSQKIGFAIGKYSSISPSSLYVINSQDIVITIEGTYSNITDIHCTFVNKNTLIENIKANWDTTTWIFDGDNYPTLCF